jgi:hypothetical protein
MSEQAVALLLSRSEELRKTAETTYQNRLESLKKEHDVIFKEADALLVAAQSICGHPGEPQIEEFEDYHKGTTDYTHYCKTCGKLLGHY